jgi:S1-C subfamily serine protease
MTPWKRESPQQFGGSGVVIARGKILTNAHVVEQASEILLETNQTTLPIQAELVGIDKTRDLALLSTSDEAFLDAHPPIPILDGLPKEGARVVVMGYPLGGEQLSTTSGVISRIEWADIGMSSETGMRVQVDAAINFGNSGGPAFVDGKVAGLAFSGMDNAMADNIAYLLATEEIKRFLDEVANGPIDGNTITGVEVQTLENPALRAKLGAGSDVSGVVVIDQRGTFSQRSTVTRLTTKVRSPSKAIAKLRWNVRWADLRQLPRSRQSPSSTSATGSPRQQK